MGPYLSVFSSSFLALLSIHGQLISIGQTSFLSWLTSRASIQLLSDYPIIIIIIIIIIILIKLLDGLLESLINIMPPHVTLNVKDFAKDSGCTQ